MFNVEIEDENLNFLSSLDNLVDLLSCLVVI